MVTTEDTRIYSIEEYLALETEADVRHEYINGEIRTMTGGTTNYNEIITNLCVALKPKLRQKNYRLFTENIRTNNNQWLLTEYEKDSQDFSLSILPLSLTLNEIYEGLDFDL